MRDLSEIVEDIEAEEDDIEQTMAEARMFAQLEQEKEMEAAFRTE